MSGKTVIIAHRRRKSDYWEGYSERFESEVNSWVEYFHSLGQTVEVFPGMSEYRNSCNRLLDKWEEKQRIHSQI